MPESQSPGQTKTQENTQPATSRNENVSFPGMMFCVAVLFDLIGLIPVLNIVSEILAGLIFGFWQKGYAPSTDPIITFFIAKIIDAASLGILPSNIGIVVYAYAKKKAAASQGLI